MNAVKVVTTAHQHRTVEILLEVLSVLVKMAMKYQWMDLIVLVCIYLRTKNDPQINQGQETTVCALNLYKFQNTSCIAHHCAHP